MAMTPHSRRWSLHSTSRQYIPQYTLKWVLFYLYEWNLLIPVLTLWQHFASSVYQYLQLKSSLLRQELESNFLFSDVLIILLYYDKERSLIWIISNVELLQNLFLRTSKLDASLPSWYRKSNCKSEMIIRSRTSNGSAMEHCAVWKYGDMNLLVRYMNVTVCQKSLNVGYASTLSSLKGKWKINLNLEHLWSGRGE